jgi:hypothetical protein
MIDKSKTLSLLRRTLPFGHLALFNHSRSQLAADSMATRLERRSLLMKNCQEKGGLGLLASDT